MFLNTLFSILTIFIIILSFLKIDQKLNKYSKQLILGSGVIAVFVITAVLDYFDLNIDYLMLCLWPLFLYLYYYFICNLQRQIAILYSFVIYLAVESTDTFLSVITSSVFGDSFINQYYDFYFFTIRIISLFLILKILSIFEVDLLYFKERIFKKFVQQLIGVYLIITLTLNTSHWLSNIAHFNSFGSMIATICFLIFLGTLVQMKTVRDRYEKKMELKQKKFEQRQMEQYMDKIQDLYAELKGFRHDFGNIITSLNLAIEERDLEDIKRIKRDVLEECYGELQKEEYTGFDLGNIRDSALRSILSRGWIYAEKLGVKLTFETGEVIEKLPMRLLDLVRTVGILVNNAIEAANSSLEKEVHIAVFNMPNGVHLIVQNSIADQPIDWNKLFDKGFSTKGDRRGMGLGIVKDIVEGYSSVFLETELINGKFTQTLVVGEKGN
jgi:possible histidine kinase; pheromone receptor